MSVDIDCYVLGPLETNCYVIRCEQTAAVVDPGMGCRPLISSLNEQSIVPSMILLTHGHGDHIAGIDPLREAFEGIELYCPAGDANMLADAQANMSAMFGANITASPADRQIRPGDVFDIGSSRWQVLDTSGHTPGGVSFYCAEASAVITGDSLFAGSIGRTDLPNASSAELCANIRSNLYSLPETIRVYPGHGPTTTIAEEKRTNPFCPEK